MATVRSEAWLESRNLLDMAALPVDQLPFGIGDATEETHRCSVLGDPPGQPVRVAAPAGDGHGQIGQVCPQQDGSVHQDVHPLARHQPADADHQWAVDR